MTARGCRDGVSETRVERGLERVKELRGRLVRTGPSGSVTVEFIRAYEDQLDAPVERASAHRLA